MQNTLRGLWLRITWFTKREGRKHLRHVTREKSRIQNPLVHQIGTLSPGYFLERTRSRTKPITRRYLDLVVYFNSWEDAPMEADEIKKYLEARLSRPCNVYLHNDESRPHGHFIFRNADEKGRALRLSIRDCRAIKNDVAKLLKQHVSPKGTGRRFVPLRKLRVNPRALEESRREQGAIVGAVDQLLQLYRGHGTVETAAVWGALRHDIGRVDPEVTSGTQLKARLLDDLSQIGFEIVFRPENSSATPGVLFLDGVPAGRIKDLPQGSLVVQVGADRYQAHLPIPEADATLSEDELRSIEGLLASRYGAEVTTFHGDRFRRLPGFRAAGAASPTVRLREDILFAGPALSWEALRSNLENQAEQEEVRVPERGGKPEGKEPQRELASIPGSLTMQEGAVGEECSEEDSGEDDYTAPGC